MKALLSKKDAQTEILDIISDPKSGDVDIIFIIFSNVL